MPGGENPDFVQSLQVVEELAAARRVLLAPRCQVQQHPMAVRQHTPGGQYRLARLPEMQPLGEALDKSWGQRHEL